MQRSLTRGIRLVVACLTAAGMGLAGESVLPAIFAQEGLEILTLRPNFFMIAGAGGNIGVQTGPDGTVVVDSGNASSADAVVAAITNVTSRPIRFVINTSVDADHVGGNAVVARAGQSLLNANGPLGALTNNGAAAIVAAERVLMRMSAPTGQAAPFPTAAWPTDTFESKRKYMFLNGEGIEILHQTAAHTDGDVIVFFRRSDVVMAGDVIDTRRFPVIDVARGGSVQGEIDALNRLVELAIPSVPLVSSPEPGTYVVPGHGRVLEQQDVVEYRDMVTIIRDRIRSLMAEGMTLEQIKAAAPARGYISRYGSDAGEWTTNMFVEAVHTSLAQTRKK